MQPDWPDWSDPIRLRVGGRSREPGEASPKGPSGPGLTASTGGPGSRLGGLTRGSPGTTGMEFALRTREGGE